MMNIYEKMQTMRCAMQSISLKKSGKNKFAGYEYFELQDIMPTINKLMADNKVSSELSYGDYDQQAVLKIVNAENPEEQMLFTCPMKMANLKGCHPVQNLGASITYIRRYLYVNAFEIVEHDALDSMPLEAKPKPQKINQEQRKNLGLIINNSKYSRDQVKEYVFAVHGFTSSTDITTDKYAVICTAISEGTIKVQQ